MKFLYFLSLLFLFTSCHYKPFIGYRLNKKGFKHFSKKEKFTGDNSNPLRNYDVKTYRWDVTVFPKSKKIGGKMTITFVPTQNQKSFMFDLQKRMKIKSFKCSINEATLKHKNDLLFLDFKKEVNPNQRIELTISYEGKPASIVGEGPLRWEVDKKNRPWISTTTEGIGPHFIMPCNLLLKDEADSVWINVTVPKGLVVSANGRLKNIKKNKHTSSYNFEVTNTMNIYNISFNVGHFVTLKKNYTDINGIDRLIECVVLDYDKEKADKFYNQAPIVMKAFEEMFGEFPWWNDGCKFIQSNFEAMEHQSGIALGSDYRLDWKDFNMTLVHELAHEWWGNNITAYDYCDAWMHEGLATYAEALFIEKMYGKSDYEKKIGYFINSTYNQIPIRKKCNVLYSSWINYSDQDIYDKGALLMHSLRVQVNNDSLFFNAIKRFQKKYAQTNIDAQQFIKGFNNLLGADYSTLFDLYLNETPPPILLYYVTNEELENRFYFKWLNPPPFELTKGISILKDGKNELITPTNEFQFVSFNKNSNVTFNYGTSIFFIANRLKV